MKFNVLNSNLDKLEKKINRAINKGAPITFSKGNEVYVSDPDNPNIKYKATEVFVDGEYIINGWEFLATLEHKENGNVIRCINSDVNVPDYYRTCEPKCDHCGVSRYRKDTYIIYNKEDEKFMQVGKSCLKDFTDGLDPRVCAEIASVIQDCESAEGYSDDDEFYSIIRRSNDVPSCFSTRDVLKYIISLVKDHGYNKEKSREILLNTLTGTPCDIEVKKCSDKLLEEVLSWINNLNNSSDYNFSCKTLANSKYIEYRDFNYLLSCVNQYFKEKINAKESNSEWVGNVGDKIEIQIDSYRILFENHYKITYYNYVNSFTYEIVDINGNIYILKTSKKIDLIETDGDFEYITPVKIKATVEDHKEYKGIKQTYIKRFKLLEYTAVKETTDSSNSASKAIDNFLDSIE